MCTYYSTSIPERFLCYGEACTEVMIHEVFTIKQELKIPRPKLPSFVDASTTIGIKGLTESVVKRIGRNLCKTTDDRRYNSALLMLREEHLQSSQLNPNGSIEGDIWSSQDKQGRRQHKHPWKAFVDILDTSKSIEESNIIMTCYNPFCAKDQEKRGTLGCKHCLMLLIERQEKLMDEAQNIEEYLLPPNEESDSVEGSYRYERIVAERFNEFAQEMEYLVKWRSLKKTNGSIQQYGYGKDLEWILASKIENNVQTNTAENNGHEYYTGVKHFHDVVFALRYVSLKRTDLF